MIDHKKFYECLKNEGVEFVTGVPDTFLNEFCLYAQNELANENHVIVANEGNAIALAVGFHLATGTVPLVYMQNSGIGNAINPLLSLTNKEVYGIPMVLLIGWRGDPEIKDHAQHQKQGELTPVLMNDMDIPFRIIDGDEETTIDSARWAVLKAKEISAPVALIARKGVFESKEKKDFTKECSIYSMNRESAMVCIMECVPKDAIFVATTGRATRELYHLYKNSASNQNMVFLNIGAMGHASSIATGIALAHPERMVVCLDGDAAAIMHLGSFTTAGKLKLSNFLHVVLNNGVHESVGGQPSAGFLANLTAIAKHSGYETVNDAVNTEGELREAIKKLLSSNKSAFIDVYIRKGIRKEIASLNVNYKELKHKLMTGLMERK